MFCPFLEKYNNLNKIGNLNQGCPFLIKRKVNRSSSDLSTYIVLLIWVILLLLMFVFFVLFYNKRVDIDDIDDEIENKKIFVLRLPVQVPQNNILLHPKSKAVEAAEGGASKTNEADCDVVEAAVEAEGTEADEEPDCEVVEAEGGESGEDTEDRRSLLSKLKGSRNIL